MLSISQKPLKTYELNIGDCLLRLKSDHDLQTVEEILQVVKKHMSQANHRALNKRKALAFSCLSVAEELVCLKKSLRFGLDQIDISAQAVFSDLKSSSKRVFNKSL